MYSLPVIGLTGISGINSVAVGSPVMIRGELIAQSANSQRKRKHIKVLMAATGNAGSTGSCNIEYSPDGSTWTVAYTFSASIPTGATYDVAVGGSGNGGFVNIVFPHNMNFVRANVTATSGATFNGYFIMERW